MTALDRLVLPSDYERAVSRRWRLAQPFRALFYRLFARIEYPSAGSGGESLR